MPTISFVYADGSSKTVVTQSGLSILDIAREHNVDLEGACEGSLACATCHVVLPKNFYDKLPPPTEAEEDMLDLAFGLTTTSRLGCQVIVTDEFDGMVVTIPSTTRNIK
ncbi:2Fe-2S iron-sulfur cluster binding domain-containing protein [Rickettsiales endosymbiont of Peranema trichophorum]|uniref:ferredoxin family 2Fe-2S iron-sulfur cluster binding protein n=1 Tax=Rickettsiales endosymbiont of Peranema trichophorum TaxID=2486577 RepID=UPI001022C00D|nr:ferredoxin family 2Fe-2S iron-sulfur cluster binding protein [Rickettsiales endosymbiont of Peranema trichophorum]RZI45775.1 2Fe-2S iron-sulfur cluster binding domain-containing protein [Rickettsiales endosymbiont of Peranema trichophorum]